MYTLNILETKYQNYEQNIKLKKRSKCTEIIGSHGFWIPNLFGHIWICLFHFMSETKIFYKLFTCEILKVGSLVAKSDMLWRV